MQGGGRGARGAGAAARLGGELGREEEREQRAPREELGADVVPQRDEAEDDAQVAPAGHAPAGAPAQRKVDVAHEPPVEGGVPAAPEAAERVLARDARGQVLRCDHAVEGRPQPEGAPDDHELEPDELQLPVGEDAERQRRQPPVRTRPAEAGGRRGVGDGWEWGWGWGREAE